MTDPKQKSSPGPDPERLKIDEDPEKALRKLVTAEPPKADEDEPEPARDDETPRGD